jgi:hypothetical protein
VIGLALLVLLAAPPAAAKNPLQGVRPPTPAEEEAFAIKEWESKAARSIQIPDAGVVAPFRWKLSNIVRETPIDGIQMVNDTPVKLHAVVVRGRLEDVVDEIYVHFLRSGLFMVPLAKQDQPLRQLQVTALDQTRAISYTAMVDGLADGTCMVMLGEANIAESTQAGLMRKAQKLPVRDFAPMMPAATSPTRVSIEGMKTLSYQVKESEAGARKFYQAELKKLGYAEVEPDLFQKDREEIQLTFNRVKDVLNVLLTSRTRLNDDQLKVRP